MRQHLTAVNAAVEVGQAEVSGNQIGSAILAFSPKTVTARQYHFSVGTAGSTNAVLQTILLLCWLRCSFRDYSGRRYP
jgi:RNA 3'-terminal phosphate cyclase (ATP)